MRDYPGVRGKLFMVTGASSGIGRATALLLGELGARVILCGRDEMRLDETLRLMPGAGHSAISRDLHAIEDFNAWLSAAMEPREEPLSGVAHCAGTADTMPLRGLNNSILKEQIGRDMETIVGLMKAAAWFLKRRDERFSFVAMSSIAAHRGQPGLGIYGASRAAMESLARTFAAEGAPRGIRFNTVAAGMVNTPMLERTRNHIGDEAVRNIVAKHPLGIGEAIDVASAIVFLLGDYSRWITGTCMIVDGGITNAS